MLINLARISVLPQQSPEYSLSPHPLHLCGHTSLRSTLPLTRTSMPALPLCGQKQLCASTRVDGGRLDDHTAILDELLDVCTRVGVADLSLLSGIEPDFAFANAGDAGGEALLRTEIDWRELVMGSVCRCVNCSPIVCCWSGYGKHLVSVLDSGGTAMRLTLVLRITSVDVFSKTMSLPHLWIT